MNKHVKNTGVKSLPFKAGDCAINCTLSIDKATISVRLPAGKSVQDMVDIAATLRKEGKLDSNKYTPAYLPHNFYLYSPQIESAYVYLEPKKEENKSKIGIGLNPNIAGKEGTADFIKFFTKYFLKGDLEHFYRFGSAGRIDCAVDIFDIGIQDAIFLMNNPDIKYSERYGFQGKKQSEVITPYDADRTTIYDKYAKTCEDNAKNKDFDPDSIPNPWTRIEKNLRSNGYMPSLLHKLNPFDDFVVARRDCPEGISMTAWNLINASIDAYGYQHTLDLIQNKKLRGQVIMALNAQPYTGWDSEAIWKQWPTALDNSGLFDPIGGADNLIKNGLASAEYLW